MFQQIKKLFWCCFPSSVQNELASPILRKNVINEHDALPWIPIGENNTSQADEVTPLLQESDDASPDADVRNSSIEHLLVPNSSLATAQREISLCKETSQLSDRQQSRAPSAYNRSISVPEQESGDVRSSQSTPSIRTPERVINSVGRTDTSENGFDLVGTPSRDFSTEFSRTGTSDNGFDLARTPSRGFSTSQSIRSISMFSQTLDSVSRKEPSVESYRSKR